jgi:L-lactate dehydrogenase (cytochrome)
MEGAAETEGTALRNTAAFDDVTLTPTCLVDVSTVRTTTRILGQELEWPVFCSPTGVSRFLHPEGEVAVAQAAAASGTLYGISTNSTTSLEEIDSASSGPKLFQLYVFKDRAIARDLIQRCKESGVGALCLTVDVPVVGKRERDLRSGFGVPIRPSPSLLLGFASRPGWLLAQARRGKMSLPVLASIKGNSNLIAQTKYICEQLDPSVEWKDVAEMIALWGGPFALKGVMSVEDARRAADLGVTAIIVSNHGGRQLDGAPSPIEVLPEIAEAVGDRIEVILDGGVRRGVHVLKALALGAKACGIGRSYLYGLGAGGAEGVSKALQLLRAELVRAMQLAGCPDVRSLDKAAIRKSVTRIRGRSSKTQVTGEFQ